MAQPDDDAAVGLLNLMKQKISKGEDADCIKVEENSSKKKENCVQKSEYLKLSCEALEVIDPESRVMESSEGQKSELEKQEKLEAKPNQDGGDETDALVTSFSEFFREEWKAFKAERKTRWCDKETEEIALDFDVLRQEWNDTENQEHWQNQAKKQKESDTCCPLFYSILVGITFVVIPNGAILFDMLAASDYLGGQWYTKRWEEASQTVISANCSDPNEECCRIINQTNWWDNALNGKVGSDVECFEKDPLWGSLTLLFLFIPGVFWSLGIFIRFASYLREKDPVTYNQKRILFFFFVPAAALCTISFPLQLMVVSIIATFNTQVSLNRKTIDYLF